MFLHGVYSPPCLQLVIWVPIAFGLGAALYKAATDTINFSTLVNALLSLFLIVVPIIWGIKAYMALKGKQRAYQVSSHRGCPPSWVCVAHVQMLLWKASVWGT